MIQSVLAVILGLFGLAIGLMGAIAVAEGVVKRGLTSVGVGAALLAAGLWMLGVFG